MNKVKTAASSRINAPENAAFIKQWKAFTKNDKRVTNVTTAGRDVENAQAITCGQEAFDRANRRADVAEYACNARSTTDPTHARGPIRCPARAKQCQALHGTCRAPFQMPARAPPRSSSAAM